MKWEMYSKLSAKDKEEYLYRFSENVKLSYTWEMIFAAAFFVCSGSGNGAGYFICGGLSLAFWGLALGTEYRERKWIKERGFK